MSIVTLLAHVQSSDKVTRSDASPKSSSVSTDSDEPEFHQLLALTTLEPIAIDDSEAKDTSDSHQEDEHHQDGRQQGTQHTSRPRDHRHTATADESVTEEQPSLTPTTVAALLTGSHPSSHADDAPTITDSMPSKSSGPTRSAGSQPSAGRTANIERQIPIISSDQVYVSTPATTLAAGARNNTHEVNVPSTAGIVDRSPSENDHQVSPSGATSPTATSTHHVAAQPSHSTKPTSTTAMTPRPADKDGIPSAVRQSANKSDTSIPTSSMATSPKDTTPALNPSSAANSIPPANATSPIAVVTTPKTVDLSSHRDAELPGVASQLINVLTPIRQTSDGGHAVTVALHPEGLGSVRATVTVNADQLVVRLNPTTSEGASAIRAALPELHSELSSAGHEATVLVSDGSQSQGSSDPGHRQQDAEPRQTTSPTSTNQYASSDASRLGGSDGMTPRNSNSTLLDVRI